MSKMSNASNLVIVESPAKARTIERYLGNGFSVIASFGHVRDLPTHKMGVDTKNKYKPEYVIPPRSRKTVTALKRAIKAVDTVYLATDPDREGEAISWHVAQATGLGNSKLPPERPESSGRAGETRNSKAKRITFSEITKEAILDAVQKPREIDMHLVDAQQARRVIDRLVGYSLSPILWRKIYKGLSAGRVQSVAVRLVVEREREIEAFKPVEYWSIEADLTKGDSRPFTALLAEVEGKKVEKLTIGSEKDAKNFVEGLEKAHYKVLLVETRQEKRTPPPPFTTSTLQQEASRRLRWSAKQTMAVAQRLYEAGHITYMRTDSVHLSEVAITAARKYIQSSHGAKYLASAARRYKTKTKGAQEAHEAIRPSHIAHAPDALGLPDARQSKLYDLIWRRMVACQMAEALYNNTTANIEAKAKMSGVFRATGIEVIFDGWRKIYYNAKDQGEAKILPELDKGDALDLKELRHEQHFTEPLPRYSEASLIKALEERGIGRPSTYAPTMSTIVDRGYVKKEQGRLHPQETGVLVNDMLVKHFPDVVDYDFTARVEEELDSIAAGELVWTKVVDDIYLPLAKQIGSEEGKIEKIDTNIATDEVCPDCGKPIVIKRGKFGQFYACTGFPECRYTKPYLTPEEEAVKNQAEELATSKKCPKCSSELKARKGRFGWFVGCSKYPECKFLENIKISQKSDVKSQSKILNVRTANSTKNKER